MNTAALLILITPSFYEFAFVHVQAREKERVNQEHIERLQSTVERMLEESNQRLRTHFAEKKALTNEKVLI